MASIPLRGWAPLLLHLPVAVVLGVRSPALAPDSHSYLHNAVVRTPAYPLYLDLCQLLPGHAALVAAVLGQHVLGALAVFVLVRELVKRWPVPWWLAVLAGWGLYVPQLEYGAYILTESLTYSALLVHLAAMLAALRERTLRAWAAAFFWGLVCWVCRPQFTFLLPVFLLFFAVDLRQAPRPEWLRRGLAMVGLLVAFNAGQQLYQRLRNNHVGGVPLFYTQVGTMMFYIAEPSDAAALPDGPLRERFLRIERRIEEERLMGRQKPAGAWTNLDLYSKYVKITQALTASYREAQSGVDPGPRGQFMGIEYSEFPQFEAYLGEVCKPLWRPLAKRYVLLMARIIWQGSHYFGLLVLITGLFSALLWLRTGAYKAGMVAYGASLWWANMTLVSFVEPHDPRYGFYTDMVALLLLSLLVADWCRQVPRAPEAEGQGLRAFAPPLAGAGLMG